MPSLKAHLYLLLMSFFTWLAFLLIGLPDYYQSWPFGAKVGICLLVTALYYPLGAFILGKFSNPQHLLNACFLALYLTLPLFIYDYIYLVLIGADDLTFVFRYWYLSLFYVSFWIQFPLIGWTMNRAADKAFTDARPDQPAD
jgi:hypothetical protein